MGKYTDKQQEIIHEKAMLLVDEGYPHRQAHAIAASMMKAGRLTRGLEYVHVDEEKPKKRATATSSRKSRAARKGSVTVERGKDGKIKRATKGKVKIKSGRGGCPVCKKLFRTRSGLAWHMKNAH